MATSRTATGTSGAPDGLPWVAVQPRPDIATRDDVERLVRAFYGRAMTDPQIGFFFTDIAHLDLEAHVPEITAFWETVLLGGQSYRGGAFAPHASLHRRAKLRAGHFARWLVLWRATVGELFEGPVADEAVRHAERVARAFHARLDALSAREAEPPPVGGLLRIERVEPR